MTDGTTEVEGVAPGEERRRAPDGLALDLARDAAGSSPEAAAEATAYLRRQNALVDLQLRHAETEQRLTLRGLRVKTVSDLLKLAFQLFAALALGGVALLVGGMAWSAAHDRSLVVEPFRTPPDFGPRGLDGAVVATRLMDQLGKMKAESQSFRNSTTYANSWSGDVKVEIPQTGVSIGDLQRLLTDRLGHVRRISGEVTREPDGQISLAVRSGDTPGVRFLGADADLDGLIDKGAEAVYGSTQPYQFSKWLEYQGRRDEALKVAQAQVQEGSKAEQAWAWTQINNLLMADGRLREGLAAGHRALALNPRLTLAWINLGTTEVGLGHEEAALEWQRRVVEAAFRNRAEDIAPAARATLPYTNNLALKGFQGDYRAAAAGYLNTAGKPDFQGLITAGTKVAADALARNHDAQGSRRLRLAQSDPDVDTATLGDIGTNGTDVSPRYFEALSLGDAKGAVSIEQGVVAASYRFGTAGQALREHYLLPHLAYAQALSGDIAAARASLAGLAADCEPCLRTRAQVEALAGNWDDADRLFAVLTARAPSIPLGWAAWGEAKLARGDPRGAERAARRALEAGPSYADASDLLSRALLAQGRMGDAVAASRKAVADAPRWGGAHLRLAQALLRAGDARGAAAERNAALSMDLTPAERSSATGLRA